MSNAKQFVVTVNGKNYEVVVQEKVAGSPVINKITPVVDPAPVVNAPTKVEATGNPIVAPMGGMVKEILIKIGDKVKDGQVVAIVEVMKMDTEVTAEFEGTVESIQVNKGDNLESGACIATII